MILVLALVAVPALYVLAAFGLALIPVHTDFVEAPPGQGIEMQLVSNGIHVDFLLPVVSDVRDWSRDFPRAGFPGAGGSWGHILVGWGDRGFYLETPTWDDLTVSTTVKAVLWPSATVVHVQYVAGRFPDSEMTRTVRLTESAYRELCAFIEESFQKDSSGAFAPIPGKSYGPTDHFFEGTGSYHAFNTCNSWTVRGMKRAGIRTALWSPFPQGVLWHLP